MSSAKTPISPDQYVAQFLEIVDILRGVDDIDPLARNDLITAFCEDWYVLRLDCGYSTWPVAIELADAGLSKRIIADVMQLYIFHIMARIDRALEET